MFRQRLLVTDDQGQPDGYDQERRGGQRRSEQRPAQEGNGTIRFRCRKQRSDTLCGRADGVGGEVVRPHGFTLGLQAGDEFRRDRTFPALGKMRLHAGIVDPTFQQEFHYLAALHLPPPPSFLSFFRLLFTCHRTVPSGRRTTCAISAKVRSP